MIKCSASISGTGGAAGAAGCCARPAIAGTSRQNATRAQMRVDMASAVPLRYIDALRARLHVFGGLPDHAARVITSSATAVAYAAIAGTSTAAGQRSARLWKYGPLPSIDT